MRELLDRIVNNSRLHGLWINTLSYLENCGARMIARAQHPTIVKEEMLKHAAEEFRHAFYLKKQLARIGEYYENYHPLLGSWRAYHYLGRLNLETCRYLQLRKLPKSLAYHLVTYAIELRAGMLYPLYQAALKRCGSKVQVQPIVLEEKEHLEEMEEALSHIPHSAAYIEAVSAIESRLFECWLSDVVREVRKEGLLLLWS